MAGAALPTTAPGSSGDGCLTTRERLLDAAEELFADRGYAGTSVRDITAAAGSNLAAVNYHFGSKHSLYRETLLRRLAAIRRQRLAALEAAQQTETTGETLAQTLRAFAQAFLAPVRSSPVERRPLRLLLREIIDPKLHGVLETELGQPVRLALTWAITATAPGLDERTVQLCAQSFLAQLVHVLHAHRFAPSDGEGVDPFELAEHVDHIVRFTIAGIERLQEIRP